MKEILKENKKIQLALSSIMFFSPLIKKELWREALIQQDKIFIDWYIKCWNINLGILLLIIISWAMSYFLENDSIYLIYQISLWALTWLIILETTFIIKNLLGNKLRLLWKR
jgi:hypothetical protein